MIKNDQFKDGFSSGDVSEITMSEDAYEDFLESLDAPLTEEEKQGRERLFQTPYPWDKSKTG